MKQGPFYNCPTYNFFEPNFEFINNPDGIIEPFVEAGFDCRCRDFNPYPSPTMIYFQSLELQGRERFWLRLSSVRNLHKPLVMTTRFELGELDLLGKEAVGGVSTIPGLPPGKTVFGFRSRCWLGVDFERGRPPFYFQSDFYTLKFHPADFRQRIARGLHTLGLSLEMALELTNTELNEHQALEWELQRREKCEEFYKKSQR